MREDWQPILFTGVLHGIILILMLGWELAPRNEIHVPDYVQARLVQLNPQAKPQVQSQPVPAPVPEKKPQEVKQADPEPDNIEYLRKQEQKKQEQQKQEKAKQEKAKQEKLKQEKLKQEKAKKQAQEKQQREAAERAAKEKALKDKALKEQAEAERRKADEALAREVAAEQAQQQQLADIEVAQSYAAMIRQRVEQKWSRPPSAQQGMEALLEIQLVPTGYVVGVRIIKSSGNPAFDLSAEQAVKKVESFVEIKDMPSRIFEAQFRRFTLRFNPEDKL